MSPNPRPPQLSSFALLPLFWQLQFAGWGAFAILSLPLKQVAFGSLGAAGMVTACQLPLGLAVSTALRQFYRRAQPARRPFIQAAGMVLAASAAACAIDVSVSIPLTRLLGVPARSELLGPAFYFFRAAIYLIWSLGYFLIKALLLAREQAFQSAIADEKYRFELLRYQLNPNFLARSLATISHTIGHDPAAARAMTARLADFYQNTLRHTDRGQAATVGDEIALLRTYLEIERLRLGECLRVRFDLDETLLPCALPPILLLPLVEKAVMEGRGTTTEPLEITVTVQRNAEGLVLLEVASSRPRHGTLLPFAEPAMDIADIRASLDRHYPGRHRFALTQDSIMVRATLCLPLTA